MGGASRFVTLLALPFPTLLHPLRPSFFLLRRRLTTLPRRPLTTSTKSKSHTPQILPLNSSQQQHFYSQPVYDNTYTLNSTQYNSHPWPEWTSFVNTISLSPIPNGHGATEPVSRQILPEDAFVEYEELSENFVRAAVSCLAFARDRPILLGLLSKKEIEVIVSNGTPYLFKNALDSARRMRNFLGMDGSNVLESDIASLVDLMKYILSYASNPSLSSERNGLFSKELVESSVRKLLHELDKVSHGSPKTNMPDSVDQFSGGYGQTSGPIRPRIEMKRGDWICSKCSFMNFARNVKCLECEGPRPKRLLTGGEWECPQCDFFNYGRNTVCLRCDRSRPGVASSNIGDTRLGYGRNGDFTPQTNKDSRLAENEEKAQRWFSKTSATSNISDVNTAASDEDFPDRMPLRKGENRFVINTRKTPLERRLASSQNQSMDPNKTLDTSVNRSFDHTKIDSRYVPFVPLTADMFSKEDQNSEVHDNKVGTESSRLDSSEVSDQSTTSTGGSHHLGGDTASQEKEKEQTENSESWFEKVAKLHDPKDLPGAISEEDFPEIMPMRRGENQFVVSKKKNRSLTSPSYKRQVAMDEANNINFVPFVPFPPGYFAKKTPQQPDVAESSREPVVPTSESSSIPEKLDEPRYKSSNTNTTLRKVDQPASSANSKFSGDLSGDRVGPPGENLEPNSSTPRPPLAAGSPELSGKQQGRSGWSGKSLEGSAVKDTDPLDMSEEAKAERWFRRVAQIKDISELSQIPDEDFPSIMPMRKGVNRFVVSKRKTPLEKRLTSQQYRRNLPVVTSDPLTNPLPSKGNNDN